MEIGVSSLPPLPIDTSDRNRTSPFAFTGNKFEFRAVGSSQSVAPANIALNAAMTCALQDIADELERATAAGQSLNATLQDLLPRLFRQHAPVLFNGNGYAPAWKEEAARRGLPDYADTVTAVEHYSDAGVMQVFLRAGVLGEREMLARQEILFEHYAKTVRIEGDVLLRMVNRQILPAVRQAEDRAARLLAHVRAVSDADEAEAEHFLRLRGHAAGLQGAAAALDEALVACRAAPDAHGMARTARDAVLPAMRLCREHADALELLVDDDLWPLPTYAELLWTH